MLNVDPSTLDFGPNSTTLSFLIENTGDQQFSWTAAMSPNSSFTLGLAKDTAPPGYSKAITVSFPRNAGLPPAVGDYSALITVEMVGGGGSATIALTAKVVTVAFQPASIFDASCDVTGQELPITTDAIVAAADDDGIASVVATWEGGIPQTLKSDTGGSDGTVWRGTVGPWPQFTGPAEVPVTVTITDTRGNVIQVTESLMIHAC